MAVDDADLASPPPATTIRTKLLSSRQERNLSEYIEDLFLNITRNYKKRCAFVHTQTQLRLSG